MSKNKIGLMDIDSKIPNLALMKISRFHKERGDSVEFYSPLWNYDKVYVSKVFKFSKEPDFIYCNTIIKGGSGYDLEANLPEEIENIYPDYSLYNCDYAMGFTTRGCIRKCPFCIVPIKEGKIKVVGDIYSFWKGQRNLMLLDNNLTALPEQFELICKQLIKEKIYTDFSQGLDIRLIDKSKAELLSKVKLWKQIHFAFDNINLENTVRKGIETLINNGVNKHKIMFYVLIGYNSTPEEDLYRVQLLTRLGVDPFVIPYKKYDNYQRKFTRWVNHKAIYKTVKWSEYVA